MQHNSTHEITLYKVKIFWSIGKFLKNLSQFDLQLHRSKILAGTAGGTKKRTTGCLFNCPSVRNNIASVREKKQVMLWWKRPISSIQNSHNRCDFQSLSRPFINDRDLPFNISYANGVSGKKLLDIPTALTQPARW